MTDEGSHLKVRNSDGVDVVEFADLANQRLTAHLKALASEPLRP